MALAPGTRLGPYEIAAQIGVGGMGEVYQATDTNLARQVAIKVLPASVASDPERLARFDREARTLAVLNHPNIAQIHGLEKSSGTIALVMELVEGPTLADRIAQGAIPVDEALPIATQIAEALEAAHEQGIIHRDLKPANIKVRPDGTVKVLDFGLAKAMEPASALRASAGQALSQAATITTPAMTQQGVILGTAAYMSPEQARGRTVDKRSDVWAFGAVLFEMLTGTRAFGGDDMSDTLANVLKTEPDWSTLPAQVPPRVTQTLRACLQKAPKQRVGDVQSLRLALEGAFDTEVSYRDRSTRSPGTWQRPIALTVAGIVLVALTAVITRLSTGAPPSGATGVSRFELMVNGLGTHGGKDVIISPDGSRIVYLGREPGTERAMLFRRDLDDLEPHLIQGTEGANDLFLSPDGQWVGFQRGATGPIVKVAIDGGPPLTIVGGELVGNATSLAWAPDDTIFFATASGVYRVSAAGGTEPTRVAEPQQGETLAQPYVLPEGRAILVRRVAGPTFADQHLAVLRLDTGLVETVLPVAADPFYVSSGHLIFVRGNTLMAAPFDAAEAAVTGDPVVLLEGIRRNGVFAADYSLSDTGTLVYVSGLGLGPGVMNLVWVDRNGSEEAIAAGPRQYRRLRVSPDGTRIAVEIEDTENTDVWIWNIVRETLTRLTFDAGADQNPIWTPDSVRVAFASTREGGGLFWQPADGAGQAERLAESADNPYAWTPDGRLIFDTENRLGNTLGDVGVVSVEGDRAAETLLGTGFVEARPALSPDGHWLAYVSNESGQGEIYVRPFPDVTGGRWQVSTAGGVSPLWAPDGRELFYQGANVRLMRVPINAERGFSFGTPEPMFDLGPYAFPGWGRKYDISPDGQRFVFLKPAESQTSQDERPPTVVVVQNWTDELRQRVPPN